MSIFMPFCGKSNELVLHVLQRRTRTKGSSFRERKFNVWGLNGSILRVSSLSLQVCKYTLSGYVHSRDIVEEK